MYDQLVEIIHESDEFWEHSEKRIVALASFFCVKFNDEDDFAEFREFLNNLTQIDYCEFCYEFDNYLVIDDYEADEKVYSERSAQVMLVTTEIPTYLRPYMDFDQYSEDIYQSIYDVYNDVSEEFVYDSYGHKVNYYIIENYN